MDSPPPVRGLVRPPRAGRSGYFPAVRAAGKMISISNIVLCREKQKTPCLSSRDKAFKKHSAVPLSVAGPSRKPAAHGPPSRADAVTGINRPRLLRIFSRRLQGDVPSPPCPPRTQRRLSLQRLRKVLVLIHAKMFSYGNTPGEQRRHVRLFNEGILPAFFRFVNGINGEMRCFSAITVIPGGKFVHPLQKFFPAGKFHQPAVRRLPEGDHAVLLVHPDAPHMVQLLLLHRPSPSVILSVSSGQRPKRGRGASSFPLFSAPYRNGGPHW